MLDQVQSPMRTAEDLESNLRDIQGGLLAEYDTLACRYVFFRVDQADNGRDWLKALAGQVTDAIFGDNPAENGTVSFGDQVVTFQRGLDTVLLTVVDLAAGTTTEIEIPLLDTSIQ